ncbi:MAG: S-layer homology domain-containing protein, partial [Lachnospiraceae bacterium]|nr:S-layer homology domain-containing protein [Lachnospiraceae bacterium]
MKKQIATLLSLILLCSIFTANASAAAEKFADVNPGAWYYTAVDYAVNEKLFSGTSATTFAPNVAMTRGMFVTVLGNKAGLDTKDYPSSSFSDVKAGTWYAPYVEWAAQNGIVTGTGNGRFSPEQSVTREQMAVILYNYAKFTDCDLTTRAGLLEQFPDGDRVSGYAKYAMEWAVTHKIISGSGGRLDPRGTATRAQVAQ